MANPVECYIEWHWVGYLRNTKPISGVEEVTKIVGLVLDKLEILESLRALFGSQYTATDMIELYKKISSDMLR